MRGSSHIRSVLIGVKYQTFHFYLCFAICIWQIQSKLQVCNLVLIEFVLLKLLWGSQQIQKSLSGKGGNWGKRRYPSHP
jgi:hypothetical protein